MPNNSKCCLGAIHREVNCSFFSVYKQKIKENIHFFLSVQIGFTIAFYLCIVELKKEWLWDFLIFYYSGL